MPGPDLNRRRFVGALLVSALPLSSLKAADAERLNPADSSPKALGYVEKASSAKDPLLKTGARCNTCALYLTEQEKGGYAPCSAFNGKLVAGPGWCKVWTRRIGL